MNIFSNPILLLIAGFFIFLVPRIFRVIAALSLVAVGVAGIYAKSDRFLEAE